MGIRGCAGGHYMYHINYVSFYLAVTLVPRETLGESFRGNGRFVSCENILSVCSMQCEPYKVHLSKSYRCKNILVGVIKNLLL